MHMYQPYLHAGTCNWGLGYYQLRTSFLMLHILHTVQMVYRRVSTARSPSYVRIQTIYQIVTPYKTNPWYHLVVGHLKRLSRGQAVIVLELAYKPVSR